METKQRKRPAAAPQRRKAASKASPQRRKTAAADAAPQRRRKTGTTANPDRAERQRRTAARRTAKSQNPPARRRVVRPPQEEIPEIIYTAPKPLTRGRFALSLLSMAAVAAAVFLALSVFFRVETIAVAGAEKYTPWMIRQAAGVEPGDALLSIGEARVASRIRMKLPYVDEIKVGIRLPGTVEIQVTELQVTYSIEDENGAWWLISADGRAVEQVTLDKALGYTRVEGLAVRTPQPGAVVQALPGQIIDPDEGTAVEQDQADADEQLSALIGVMTALEKNRIIGEIALIDVTDVTAIRLEYPQLLTVRLGDAERMDYKISYLAAAVEELADTQSGELDLSLEYTEDAVFAPAR
ncbi:MAG: FtsQ-type POTRA domain-containing protein [Oscillospiraceae bacterium]|nr:FtsQ-type POTRA domain-containing protein [Oscillospiraceae bacterium]